MMGAGLYTLIGLATTTAGVWLPLAFVVGAFVAAFSAGLVSHAPGGLGVLELTFLKVAPQIPAAPALAALLAFRLFYLLLPLAISRVVAGEFERRRWAARRAQ